MLTSILFLNPTHKSSTIPSCPSKNKFALLHFKALFHYECRTRTVLEGLGWGDGGEGFSASNSLAIKARPLFWTSQLISNDSPYGVTPFNPQTHSFDVHACSADSWSWEEDQWTEMTFWTPTSTASLHIARKEDRNLPTQTLLEVFMFVTLGLNVVFKIFTNIISLQAPLWTKKMQKHFDVWQNSGSKSLKKTSAA